MAKDRDQASEGRARAFSASEADLDASIGAIEAPLLRFLSGL